MVSNSYQEPCASVIGQQADNSKFGKVIQIYVDGKEVIFEVKLYYKQLSFVLTTMHILCHLKGKQASSSNAIYWIIILMACTTYLLYLLIILLCML